MRFQRRNIIWLCLVVEVPNERDILAYNCAKNGDQAMNPEWWMYVSAFHVVMPNVRQIYIFRNLRYKHYHCNKALLLAEVEKSGFDIPVHIHKPDCDV